MYESFVDFLLFHVCFLFFKCSMLLQEMLDLPSIPTPRSWGYHEVCGAR